MDTVELSDPLIYFRSDTKFNQLYPAPVRKQAKVHWTPLHIARLACEFLAEKPGAKVLDIGSGAGKFCLTAACYAPEVFFYGVEQRTALVRYAREAQLKLGVTNVRFIEDNFTRIDLTRYNHFYFYNSFYENLDDTNRIDEDIPYSAFTYQEYVRTLYLALKQMPKGTRIVTFHSMQEEIPREYHLADSLENGDLNFWVRR